MVRAVPRLGQQVRPPAFGPPTRADDAGVEHEHHVRQLALAGRWTTRHLLDLAADAAGVGAWEWDIATGAVRWNAALEELYGLEPGAFPGTHEDYVKLRDAEDRANARQAVQRTPEEGGPHPAAHRVPPPDGRARWAGGRGRRALWWGWGGTAGVSPCGSTMPASGCSDRSRI